MAKQTRDPIQLFGEWFEEAMKKEKSLPDAVALATAGQDLMPHVRMVLLKGFDQDGFVFYTNLGSNKGLQLRENPQASLCFYWKSMDKQVRVEGSVEQVTDEVADAYFASRARDSRIGAWASKQSQELKSRLELEKRISRFGLKFGIGKIPRPEFWSGYNLKPSRIEFWEQRPFRLHKRTEFTRTDEGGWDTVTLFP
jgi:pyridoxamine 5'-phosphate oxidase